MLSSPPQKFSKMLDWYAQNKYQSEAIHDRVYPYAPWLAPYIYRKDGIPRYGSINKWENRVRIGIGWPEYALDGRQPLGKISQPELNVFRRYIGEEIKSSLPALRAATGLEIDFVAPDDDIERGPAHAEIRIVPVQWREVRGWLPNSENTKNIESYERWLFGAVLFASSDHRYMEGYLLPNQDNSLGMAVCKIMAMDISESSFRGLVRECLVRSMGLPGMSRLNAGSLVGPWHEVTNEGAKQNSDDIVLATPPDPLLDARNSYRLTVRSLPDGIPEYDRVMLSLLYCDSITPGMDKNAIVDIFTRKSLCQYNYKGDQ